MPRVVGGGGLRSTNATYNKRYYGTCSVLRTYMVVVVVVRYGVLLGQWTLH